MTQITVAWRTSEKLQKQEYIKTGKLPLSDRLFYLDLVELTPEQREPIIAFLGLGHCYLNTQSASKFNEKRLDHLETRLLKFDNEPTVDDVVGYVLSEKAARDAAEAYEAKVKSAKKAETDFMQLEYDKLRPRIEALVESSDLAVLKAFVFPVKGIASFGPSGCRASLYKLLSDAIKDASKAKRKGDKADWIAAHGSEHLKRAHAGRYDAQRLYVTERAAMEAPEFTVDFDEGAKWKDRSCPSLAALDAEAEAEALGLYRPVMVVWLTAPAQNTVGDYDYYDFEECEAVVIQDYLGYYDLVKML